MGPAVADRAVSANSLGSLPPRMHGLRLGSGTPHDQAPLTGPSSDVGGCTAGAPAPRAPSPAGPARSPSASSLCSVLFPGGCGLQSARTARGSSPVPHLPGPPVPRVTGSPRLAAQALAVPGMRPPRGRSPTGARPDGARGLGAADAPASALTVPHWTVAGPASPLRAATLPQCTAAGERSPGAVGMARAWSACTNGFW